MASAKKIQPGVYTYKGYTIDKDLDFPELDWRVYDVNGEWLDSYILKRDAIAMIDQRS
jgi:hypothetical protein